MLNSMSMKKDLVEESEQDSFEFTMERTPSGDYMEFFQGWECLSEMQKALFNATSEY